MQREPVLQEVFDMHQMEQLTVELSELFLVQHFIALLGGAGADFHQRQDGTRSSHNSDGVSGTTELQ